MPTSWTKEEEKQLITELKENKSFEELSKIHNRSISALMMRYNKIIYDNVEAGKSKKSLAKLLNTTVDKITQSYYEHKAFIEKKETINNEKVEENKKSEEKVKVQENEKVGENDKLIKTLKLLQKENKILKDILQNLENKKKLEKNLDNKELYNYVMKILKKNLK
jgi:hypothetical protein